LDSRRSGDRGEPGHPVTLGITDLMTSLAVIFVLLLVVFASVPRQAEDKPEPRPAAPVVAAAPPVDSVAEVREAFERLLPEGLVLERDPRDPQALRVVIPESLLHFEFGKSSLTPSADRFLASAMPAWAKALCGDLRGRVAGVVIEGHTDDLGGDALNLRLSQERSFRVLVRGLEAIQATAPDAHACFSELASASGRGKQDLVYDDRQRPDRELSRRVVLKILLRPSGGSEASRRPPRDDVEASDPA
jgi:outer membrane protein OmpA-like peptidoglycan-associated protein